MKTALTVLALLNGGYMLADGIYVTLNGKYIGPQTPGPWALPFQSMHIDVFTLGPLFIALGLLWLFFLLGLWTKQTWTRKLGIAVAVLTLWYMPLGSVFSALVLIIFITSRHKINV